MIRTQAEWEAAAFDALKTEVPVLGPTFRTAIVRALWPTFAPLVAAVEQAEQTIRDAPHESYCEIVTSSRHVLLKTCTCWKARYLSRALTREGSNG